MCEDVDVECLAAWQDEQSNFLIGRLVSRDKTSKHGRYRCIVREYTWSLNKLLDC